MLRMRLLQTTRRDEGLALAVVLGLLAVGLIMTSLVLTSVVGAMGFSTYTRAGVQSQAAAEAGIAAARAGLTAGTCTGSAPQYTNAIGETPAYVATIWRPSGTGGWTAGCPIGTTTQVRIISTGYAVAGGISGVSDGDTTVLEAILAASSAPVSLSASGPAIYAYSAGALGNGGRLVSIDGSTPDVLVKTGNVSCTGAGQGAANFVVEGGTLAVGNSCEITGNAFSSGRMTFSGNGWVGGFAVANGITMQGSSRIYGRAWSRADFTTDGNPTLSGILKAQSAALSGGTVSSQAYIYGNTTVGNAGATTLGATFTTQTANPAPPNWWSGNSRITKVNPITAPTFNSDLPATPTVPNWVDFGSRADDYTSTVWAGFTVYTMGTNCSASAVQTAVNAIGTNPGVIDGRLCSGALTVANNDSITVRNDLAIIANRISIGNSGLFTSTSMHRLWLINPDAVDNDLPTCNGSLSISGNHTHFTNLNVLIFTPCAVDIASGTLIRGQIFAGAVTLGGSAQISYVPVGLPGVDLSTGTTTPTTSSATSRTLLSLRNVAG